MPLFEEFDKFLAWFFMLYKVKYNSLQYEIVNCSPIQSIIEYPNNGSQ